MTLFALYAYVAGWYFAVPVAIWLVVAVTTRRSALAYRRRFEALDEVAKRDFLQKEWRREGVRAKYLGLASIALFVALGTALVVFAIIGYP